MGNVGAYMTKPTSFWNLMRGRTSVLVVEELRAISFIEGLQESRMVRQMRELREKNILSLTAGSLFLNAGVVICEEGVLIMAIIV